MAVPAFVNSTRVYNSPAATANYSVARPSGVLALGAGVVLLAFVRRARSDALTPVVPTMAGWTSAAGTAVTATERMDVFYRLSVAAEPTNYVIQTGSSGGIQEAVVVAYTSAYPIGSGSTFVGTSNPTGIGLFSHSYSPTVLDQVAVTQWLTHSAPVTALTGVVVQYGERKFVVSGKTITSLTAGQSSVAETAVGNAANYTATFLLTPFNRAPYKPTLIAPIDGKAVDMAVAGSHVSWTHNDPDGPFDTQSAYRLRRNNGTIDEWWTGSAWAGSETSVTSTSNVVTFLANKWTNGVVYVWSVATADQDTTWGPYSDLSVVYSDSTPTVTVDGPLPLITDTTRPQVSWTYTQAESNPQLAYEVKVFTSTVATAAGFDPTTSRSATWAIAGTGAAADVDVAIDLTNKTTYRAYVRAAQDHDLWSEWLYTEFYLDLEVPPPPTVVATEYLDELTGVPLVRLEAVSHHNLLSAGQAHAVSTELQSRANATVDVIVSADEGTEVTSVASGQVAVETVDPVAVSGGGTYTVSAEFSYDNATTGPRNVAVGVVGYDDDGNEVGVFLTAFELEQSEADAEEPPPSPVTPPSISIFLSTSPDRTNPILIGTA